MMNRPILVNFLLRHLQNFYMPKIEKTGSLRILKYKDTRVTV